MKRPDIVVFDSDTASLLLIEEALVFEGYTVLVCHTFADLGAFVRRHRPRLIIAEHRFNQPMTAPPPISVFMNDQEAANIPIIYTTTNHQNAPSNTPHLREQTYTVLVKPFDLDDLYRAVARALGADPASPRI